MFPFYKKIARIAIGITLLLLATGISQAADQDIFLIYALEVEGDIFGYVTGDVDGDRLTDVVIVYSPSDDRLTRYAGLFVQNVTSGFNLRPDYLIRLSQTTVQIDAGDINDDGKAEILLVDADGVSVMRYNPGVGPSQPVRLIRRKTIYGLPFFHGILDEPLLFQVNSSPGPEIIIPTPKGYAVFEKGDEGDYEILNQLEAPIYCRNSGKGLKDFANQYIFLPLKTRIKSTQTPLLK